MAWLRRIQNSVLSSYSRDPKLTHTTPLLHDLHWLPVSQRIKFRTLIHVFKGPYADHILIPPGSTESSTFFWYQMKACMFLVSNPKFQLQILCSFGDMTKNVKLIGIPENNFLCIFIIASSPGVHTFFCLWRVNKKLPEGWNFTKCISEIKINQLKVKNVHV